MSKVERANLHAKTRDFDGLNSELHNRLVHSGHTIVEVDFIIIIIIYFLCGIV